MRLPDYHVCLPPPMPEMRRPELFDYGKKETSLGASRGPVAVLRRILSSSLLYFESRPSAFSVCESLLSVGPANILMGALSVVRMIAIAALSTATKHPWKSWMTQPHLSQRGVLAYEHATDCVLLQRLRQERLFCGGRGPRSWNHDQKSNAETSC